MDTPESVFLGILLAASLFAGGVAAISGFGIGSVLTPILSCQIDIKLAVAAVSVPHLVATALRFYMLRESLNKEVFLKFGILSAVGGLAGAVFHSQANEPLLIYVFAGLLIFVGAGGLVGLTSRLRFSGRWSWLAGALSGFLGGMVGNQGGIRSAALMGFELSRAEFVATATAVGVVVDLARIPVYLLSEGADLLKISPSIVAATLGCILGTFVGKRLLLSLSEQLFRLIISGLILALGAYMLTTAYVH